MREVDPAPFTQYMGTPLSPDLGMKPGLTWLPVSCLRIDPSYQREVLRRGARNVGKIAREFNWSLFGVVVVANIGGNLFAIVDGQHRTIAASLRGIEEVPCLIIDADVARQAEAFAAINGAVTAISSLAIFAAEVTAGKPGAIALRDACAAAGVNICKYPVPANNMKPGDTLAIAVLKAAMKTYGPEHLTLSLKCITKTGRHNTGLVKSTVIQAICHVLDAERSWCSPEARLLSAMSRFDLHEELIKAEIEGKRVRQSAKSVLAMHLFDFLDEELGA